eukprot:CAMPEP_0194363260 /NCGR_PEP_ID=MMETSP0174-20130528/11104_1 /TAXON_ID=216777 /ORGANISM="Proboscia alata, Strain PI-D3" /LENGTH=459 /DNA_ID=CAMNT_0039136611 /DNA_START=1000 /DNA_END=2379 /DNA_ORIENTATION=-
MALLGIKFEVRNAAIGGIPSFPYGWCMPEFLGYDADLISWDHSMNEAGDLVGGLEAYVRHGIQMEHQPLIFVKDTHMATKRRAMLQKYIDDGVILDSFLLVTDPATTPFLDLAESSRPSGFQKWRKFGAPPNTPGPMAHHPAVKEHEWIAWMIALHFLSVLEIVAADIASGVTSVAPLRNNRSDSLPKPVTLIRGNEFENVLFGYPTNTSVKIGGDTQVWKMTNKKCLTTFQPSVPGSELENAIVSGRAAKDVSVMEPKSMASFNKGWVLDLGHDEKNAKRILHPYNGLGFMDSKQALYGVKASGTLSFFLRFDLFHTHTPKAPFKESVGSPEVRAETTCKSITVCQVNESRDEKECDIQSDLEFTVGGVSIPPEDVQIINADGISYKGKKLCVYFGVPERAKPVVKNLAIEEGNEPPSAGVPDLSAHAGIELGIAVINESILLRNGPCSVSHIIWEQA